MTKAKNASGYNPYFRINYSCLVPVSRKSKSSKRGKGRRTKDSRIQRHIFSIQRILGIQTRRNPKIKVDKKRRKICFTY
jgi:hypothetical protein